MKRKFHVQFFGGKSLVRGLPTRQLDKSGEFGSMNHYDYGFRIYNPGIGRFLSVDPLTGSYPGLTPYQFASNTPIMAIDLDGLEAWVITYNHLPNKAKPVITWRLDMKKKNIDQIYSYHKYWNTKGQLMAMASGTANFSDFPKEFPDSGPKKPFITFEGSLEIVAGEIAIPVGKLGSVEFGAEVSAVKLSFQSDRKDANGKPKRLARELMDGSDPVFNLGGEAAVGMIGMEYRQEYYPARGEWGDKKLEVDFTTMDDPGFGAKIDMNLSQQDAAIRFGIPEFKYAMGVGFKTSATISINPRPWPTSKQRQLNDAIEFKKLKDAFSKPPQRISP